MTIREAIYQSYIKLKVQGMNQPKLKARLLMQFVLKQSRQYLMVYDEKELTKEQETTYKESVGLLIKGIPLQYITHTQEFMKMDFYINSKVLIPRPDTEVLVEEIISIAKQIKAKKILELGTGSGAIAISLARYIKNCQITAIDISQEALKIAQLNAKRQQVEKRVTFLLSNLFENLPKEKYDMIVSNPPYIKQEQLKTLEKEVQNEPRLALDGGKDGLLFYRKIIHQAYEFLKYKGYLCFEIGYDQKNEVMDLIEQEGKFRNTYGKKDLYGNDRIIITNLRS